MKLLAFEMSSPQGSIALQVDDQYEQVLLSAPRKQIEQVLPVVDSLLQKFNIQLSELDYLLLSTGPGSFTGLRVALGVVQGLSLGLSIPIIALSSLATLAQTTHYLTGANKVICCVNAFMQQIYFAEYAECAGLMQPTTVDTILHPDELSLQDTLGLTYVGDGWQVYPELIPDNVVPSEVLYPQAFAQFSLAQHQIEKGSSKTVSEVQLNYLRDKSAWTKKST